MRKLLCALLVLCSTLAYAQMDKALHTTAGFGITITVSSITNKPTLGLAAGIGAGIGKEIWDSQRRGHDASARDALATAAGAGGAFVVFKLLNRKHPTVAAAPASPEKRPEASAPPKAVAAAKSAGMH